MIINKKIKKKLIICLEFSIILLLRYNYKHINEDLIKYDLNPILGNSNIGTVFDPFVIYHNNLYKMYVSWRPKEAIALSTSNDGLNWSDLKIVLNKGKLKSWETIVNRACVLIFNNKFYMWYTGQHNGKSEIGFAISDNGEKFTKYKNNPILKPEYRFEKQSVMNPHVIYDKEEKIFKMWFAAGETYEPDVLCYAISKDGINWIKYKDNPIFLPSRNIFSLDSFKIGACDMHKITDTKYLMFYIGYSDINTARIFFAESKNGINNWKRSNNPIITPTKNRFDNNACYKPSALYDNINKRWMIWYNGRRKNEEFIGVAFYYK